MSLKYRIRLQNNRVIGPFTTEEIGELYLKKHINGDEDCQQFPIGSWKNFSTFPHLVTLIQKISQKNSVAAKIEIKADHTQTQKTILARHKTLTTGIKAFKEFKFGKNVNLDIDYAELEKNYNDKKPKSKSDSAPVSEVYSTPEVEYGEDGLEKTRVLRKKTAPPSAEMEKTKVILSKSLVPKKDSTETRTRHELEKKENVKAKEQEEKNALSSLPTREDLVNEKTEVFNLSKVLPTINAQLSISEVELENKARIEENNERKRQQELQELIQIEQEEDEYELEDEEVEEGQNDSPSDTVNSGANPEKLNGKPKKKRKKGMSLIVALAFLGIFYVLLSPDDKPKETGPLFLDVKFPITQEFEDKAAASAALVKGRTLYAKNNYMNRAVASQLYIASLQKQFSNNEALGELILTYSELIDDTKDPKASGNILYKLIELSENKMLSDLNVVTGAALFYGKIGKHQTGINLVKNYLRAKNPPSGKLLAYYLDLQINAGDLVEARKTFTVLNGTAKKPLEAYSSLAHFYEVNEQPAEARTIVDEGIKYFPNSALLLLKKADYLFQDQSPEKYEDILLKVNQINSEASPVLTAKFYHHMGLLSALKKKNAEATVFFKKSLAIKESDELRSMLSRLEIGGDKFAQSLILESKVLDLISKANAELKNKNYEAAFSYSIEAVDTNPDYVPAILLQTQLQLRRGLYDSAIDNLQKAIGNNPGNNTLKKNLIRTYLDAYKFDDAQKALVEISQTKYALSHSYASLMGDFNTAKNYIPLAVRWYSEALSRDPLSDYDMFQLVKIYLRVKKFNDAKVRLAKALLLDPRNPEYLATNAEILFEQDSTDTGIGYLRDAISEIGEDPKLLSAIATLYYKSGQIKEFNNYYKRILALPKKDENFFEFLMYAAKMEEKTEDYITYARELLKLNPGILKVRLDLGELFYNQRRYPEAIAEFEEVRARLVSFPKVHYMLAKVYLAMNDVAKAKEMALKELELNSTLDTAHFIVGEVARIENDYREAVSRYEKAISLNPRSVDALMAMAWIRLAQNYGNDAIELYSRALKEDRTNPEIYKQLGFAYKSVGQRAVAKEKFEEYLKISPGAFDRGQIEAQIRNLQ